MNELILDVKILIASNDENLWYYFYRYDHEFNKYASTKCGKQTFINLFTVCTVEKTDEYTCEKYYLFGKLHRDTLPAIIYSGKKCACIKNNKLIISLQAHTKIYLFFERVPWISCAYIYIYIHM